MTKLVFAALAAALLLSFAAGTASALRSLSVSSTTITLLSRALTFTSRNLGVNVVCEVGMTIRLERNPIAKRVGQIGMATVRILRCAENTATVLGGTFPVNFLGFLGTLPNITGLVFQLLRAEFSIEAGGLATCLIRANVAELQVVSRGVLGALSGSPYRLEGTVVRRIAGLLCPTPEETQMKGVFEPTGTPVTITLV
jgi:hypothetical protein